MALDPDFAIKAFTLVASICAAEFIDKALSTCGRIEADSETAEYYSCGVKSFFATAFAFASVYGLYTIYKGVGRRPITLETEARKA